MLPKSKNSFFPTDVKYLYFVSPIFLEDEPFLWGKVI
jgi:hypothetical protein